MEHSKAIRSIDLGHLMPSLLNARRHSAGQVEELVALIDSQGLLHHLMVTEQRVGRGRARQPRFAVVVGERRRRALLLLQQRGRLPKAYEVQCELAAPERALEVSLAENSGREAMHPADEFEAFKALIDSGKGVEDVAARLGVSALTVQRRLKLAALSPRLLALYRADGINLDQLMALTLSDDHALQERTWFDARPWGRVPLALRRGLTAGEVEASGSALARFVGIDAYEAAGGVVRRDLFDDERNRLLSDPTLLERLATDKLEVLAGSVREEGWRWVEARLSVDAQALRLFTPSAHAMREPMPVEQEELDALALRCAELDRLLQALDDAPEWSADEAEALDLEREDIRSRREAVQEGLRTWEPDAKVLAGAIVTVSREGDAQILRGLVRQEDRTAMPSAQRSAGGQPDHAAGQNGDASLPETSRSDRRPSGCSESLTRRLAAHRTMALQAVLAQNTAVAMASLAHVFVLRVFAGDYPPVAPVLRFSPLMAAPALEAAADELKGGRAWQMLQQVKDVWQARLPARQDGWLHWLVGLPMNDLIELLALRTALTANALPGTGADSHANAIGAALGLDLADRWQATAEGYLRHVPKAQVIQALKEAGPELAGGGVEAMKKDELVVAASRLAGTRWVPEPLRVVSS